MLEMNKNDLQIPLTITSTQVPLMAVLHKTAGSKLIIMCHGFTGNKIENRRLFVQAARAFSAEGYNVLRFDFFGSGDSPGEFEDSLISIYIENLKDVIQWGVDNGYQDIGVLGLSMGAGTAILTVSGQPVKILVTWSAVPDIKKLFETMAPDEALRGDFKVYDYNGWLIKREFMSDALQYDIKQAVTRVKIPKLIVQGSLDNSFFVHGFRMFQDYVVPPCDFMEIPGADHTYQNPAHRRQVIRQTIIWLKRHF
jgi:hypothetical protein